MLHQDLYCSMAWMTTSEVQDPCLKHHLGPALCMADKACCGGRTGSCLRQKLFIVWRARAAPLCD